MDQTARRIVLAPGAARLRAAPDGTTIGLALDAPLAIPRDTAGGWRA